jgi:hypothetical protein
MSVRNHQWRFLTPELPLTSSAAQSDSPSDQIAQRFHSSRFTVTRVSSHATYRAWNAHFPSRPATTSGQK